MIGALNRDLLSRDFSDGRPIRPSPEKLAKLASAASLADARGKASEVAFFPERFARIR